MRPRPRRRRQTATRPRQLYAEQARTLRDALLAADTVLAVWREPLRGAHRGRGRRRPLGRARRPPARPPPDAGRARRARAPPDRRAGLRRAHARRGPPADGHRLRAAGRRPRLPAARRPRALPRGLRRARRRARARAGRAPRAPGGARSGASSSSTAARTSRSRPASALAGACVRRLAADRRRRASSSSSAVSFVARPLADHREPRARRDLRRCSSTQARGDAARHARAPAGLRRRAARRPSRRTPAGCAARRRRRSCAWTRRPPTRSARPPGPTRVAWTVVDRRLPVVQCVDVERAGSALAGRRLVTLRAISAPRSAARPRADGPPQPRSADPCSAPSACAARLPILLAAAALLAAAGPAAAQSTVSTPSARTLYKTGPTGRFLMDGQWLFRSTTASSGPAGWRPASTRAGRPSRVPNAWNASDDSPRVLRRRASAGTARTSACPARPRAPTWVVRFESVNYRSKVWLNGKPIGTNRGAYLPFEMRLPAEPAQARRHQPPRRSASTAAAARRTSRPRACRRSARPPAAGGTTAACCARSTCARSTTSTSTRSPVQPAAARAPPARRRSATASRCATTATRRGGSA